MRRLRQVKEGSTWRTRPASCGETCLKLWQTLCRGKGKPKPNGAVGEKIAEGGVELAGDGC